MTSIQSSGDKLSTHSQLKDSSLTNSSSLSLDNNTGLSEQTIGERNSTNQTTEEKNKE